jgi:hypothetical protein
MRQRLVVGRREKRDAADIVSQACSGPMPG